MALASCEVTAYPENLTKKQVYTFEARATDWVANVDRDGLNLYYSCHFNLTNLHPETTLDRCAVVSYINLGDYEQVLPITRHYENSLGQLWTRTIDFDYSLSDVNFYVTNSDFAVGRPETMYFRVMFIW
ncbi:hypothetical protein FACS1894156_8560 [Bacteroidia bacterium]|nr:hypothetical protein FACS1894156_8560 [Bacteroidia bacterium]